MSKPKGRRRRSWDYAKQLEELREFVTNPEQRRVSIDENLAEIDELLRRKPQRLREICAHVTTSFEVMSNWWATTGAVAVGSGDPAGWLEIDRGFRLLAFSAWLRHRWVEIDRQWDKEPFSCSLLSGSELHIWAYAIAAGHDDFAHRLGRHLLGNLRRFHGGDKIFTYTVLLLPFLLRLYATWVGEEPVFRSDVANPLGRYQQIFDTWTDPEGFAAAVHDICVYHGEQTFDGPGYPAFEYPPYNIFPVEVLALQRVRRELGLAMPAANHPLLETPLAHIPEGVRTEEPIDLIDQMLAYIREAFPAVGEPWVF